MEISQISKPHEIYSIAGNICLLSDNRDAHGVPGIISVLTQH
jgi:hypothetical protein